MYRQKNIYFLEGLCRRRIRWMNCLKGKKDLRNEMCIRDRYISDIECYGNNEKQKEDNIALVVSRNALTDAVYVGDIQSCLLYTSVYPFWYAQ